MSLDFHLTKATALANPSDDITPLSMGMTYIDFSELQNDIREIAHESTIVDPSKHPGYVKYQHQGDDTGIMTAHECMDLYQLLKSNAFADLEWDYRACTFMDALKSASIKQRSLMWM